MATIRTRGAYQWQAIVKHKGYKPVAQTFETRRLAAQWARGVEAEMDLGKYSPPAPSSTLTLAHAIERYRMQVTPTKKGAPQESRRLNVLLKWPLTARDLTHVTSADIAQYRDQRLGGAPWVGASLGRPARHPVAGQTVRTELALISSIYKVARREWGYPRLVNPVDDVTRPAPSRHRDRRLHGEDEWRYLRDALADYAGGWLLPLVELSIETAARRGELHDLRPVDVDLAAHTAVLRDTKNGTDREVALSSKACKLLAGLCRRAEPGEPIIAVTPHAVSNGFQVALRRARTCYERDCAESGAESDPGMLTGLRWHDLRHEATSRLFEKGLDSMEVASITGHKTLAMLKRYTHLKAKKLAKKLG